MIFHVTGHPRSGSNFVNTLLYNHHKMLGHTELYKKGTISLDQNEFWHSGEFFEFLRNEIGDSTEREVRDYISRHQVRFFSHIEDFAKSKGFRDICLKTLHYDGEQVRLAHAQRKDVVFIETIRSFEDKFISLSQAMKANSWYGETYESYAFEKLDPGLLKSFWRDCQNFSESFQALRKRYDPVVIEVEYEELHQIESNHEKLHWFIDKVNAALNCDYFRLDDFYDLDNLPIKQNNIFNGERVKELRKEVTELVARDS